MYLHNDSGKWLYAYVRIDYLQCTVPTARLIGGYVRASNYTPCCLIDKKDFASAFGSLPTKINIISQLQFIFNSVLHFMCG